MTDTQQTTKTISKQILVDDDGHEINEDGLFIISGEINNENGQHSELVDKDDKGPEVVDEEELEYDDDEYVINQDNSYEDVDSVENEKEEDEEEEEEEEEEAEGNEKQVNGRDTENNTQESIIEEDYNEKNDDVLNGSEYQSEIENEEPYTPQISAYQETPQDEDKVPELQEDSDKPIIENPQKNEIDEQDEDDIQIIINEDEQNNSIAEGGSIEDIEMIPQLQQLEHPPKSTEHTINEDLDDVITLTEDPEFAQPIESTSTTTAIETPAMVPVHLIYFDNEFLLFPDNEEPTIPRIFENDENSHKSIEEFFALLREDSQLNEIEPFLISEEIILTIPQLGNLRITEDNLYCRDININEFVNLFRKLSEATKDKTKIPNNLTFELTTQSRFITKYNALVDSSLNLANGGFDYIEVEEEQVNDETKENEEPVIKKRKIE